MSDLYTRVYSPAEIAAYTASPDRSRDKAPPPPCPRRLAYWRAQRERNRLIAEALAAGLPPPKFRPRPIED